MALNQKASLKILFELEAMAVVSVSFVFVLVSVDSVRSNIARWSDSCTGGGGAEHSRFFFPPTIIGSQS